MVWYQEVHVAIMIEIAKHNIIRKMPGGKRRAKRRLEVSFSIPQQNADRLTSRVGNDDVQLAIMIEIRHGD